MVCTVHQILPFFEKVGLACETIDRGEERDGKQREIKNRGEDEHQEAESVLPLPCLVNGCVQLFLILMLLGFVTDVL